MNAPAFIPPGAQVPELHVEIVRYTGKNGGYARVHVEMWIARLVSPTGRRRLCKPESWHGHTDPRYAQHAAEDWAGFLGGVPIVRRTGPENAGGHVPEDNELVLDQVPAR